MLGSFLGNLIYIYHLSVPFGKIFAGVTGFFLWDVFRGLDYCPCRSGKCVCRDGKAFGTEEGDWMDCNLYCSRENT